MKMTRAIASLLCVFMLLACLPMQAMAAGQIDTEQTVSLDIICQDNEIALSGVRFDLYHIAHVDENGNVTVNNDLSKYAVSAQGDSETDWKDLAATLEIYVLRDNIPPSDSTQSNINGLASFPSQGKELKQGLYLVTGQRHSQGDRIYDTEPFLIMLPATDAENGEWLYDTTVYSKFASYKLPDGGEENTIKRKVLKKWDDDGYEKERPKEITVQLLRDGKVYDTVKLNAKNNWSYEWVNLDISYKWTVAEKNVPDDYKVSIRKTGITYVITNTYEEEPPPSDDPPTPQNPPNPPATPPNPPEKPPELPQTGQLWWPVPVLLAAGLFFIVFGLIRRKGGNYEE